MIYKSYDASPGTDRPIFLMFRWGLEGVDLRESQLGHAGFAFSLPPLWKPARDLFNVNLYLAKESQEHPPAGCRQSLLSFLKGQKF